LEYVGARERKGDYVVAELFKEKKSEY